MTSDTVPTRDPLREAAVPAAVLSLLGPLLLAGALLLPSLLPDSVLNSGMASRTLVAGAAMTPLAVPLGMTARRHGSGIWRSLGSWGAMIGALLLPFIVAVLYTDGGYYGWHVLRLGLPTVTLWVVLAADLSAPRGPLATILHLVGWCAGAFLALEILQFWQ